MKISCVIQRVVIGTIICNTLLFCDEQNRAPAPTQTENRPPLYINVNYIPNENNFIIGDSALKAILMRYYEAAKDAADKCGNYVKQQQLTISATFFNAASYVGDHKLQSALTSLLLVYVAVQARVYYVTRLLIDQQNWSLWHHDTPLEELFATPPQQLCSTLLAEVQRRYTTPNNVHDVVQSLTRFIEDTEKEAALLKEYKSLSDWLAQCKIRELSLINVELAEACTDRLQRLAFIKGTFLGWITEYRLGMRPAGSFF